MLAHLKKTMDSIHTNKRMEYVNKHWFEQVGHYLVYFWQLCIFKIFLKKLFAKSRNATQNCNSVLYFLKVRKPQRIFFLWSSPPSISRGMKPSSMIKLYNWTVRLLYTRVHTEWLDLYTPLTLGPWTDFWRCTDLCPI